MKQETLKIYFDEIEKIVKGNHSSNSNIIDYRNGSIDIYEIEQEYNKYLELSEEIDNYIELNELDDIFDKEKIIKHFNNINKNLFEFNQARLIDFPDYLVENKRTEAEQ